MKKLATCCNTLLLAATLGTSAWAASPIYVDASAGLDTNDGVSPATAVKTLTKGLELVDSSGTLQVAAGAYTDALVLEKPVVLNGANAGISPNTGTRGAESVITADGPMITISAGSEGSVIDGFKFTGAANDAANGIIRGTANDGVVKNNIVDGNSGHGMYISGVQGWTIEDNLIQNVTGTSRSGMFLITFQNSTVKNNTIKDTVYAGMICDTLLNVTIEGNTIQNVPQPGIQVAHSTGLVTVTKNNISQANTANGSDKGAIAIYPDSTMVEVTFNTLTNSNGAFAVRGQAGAVAETVHVNNNNIIGNTAPAVKNRAQGGGTLDATNNWWGTATGPSVADLAEPNVTLIPWLTDEASVAEWLSY